MDWPNRTAPPVDPNRRTLDRVDVTDAKRGPKVGSPPLVPDGTPIELREEEETVPQTSEGGGNRDSKECKKEWADAMEKCETANRSGEAQRIPSRYSWFPDKPFDVKNCAGNFVTKDCGGKFSVPLSPEERAQRNNEMIRRILGR
ncbi:hypothetical protein JQ604_30885 [Bradyrhizobium jicamae]|uniref:hypothetical protein n=1 Tax=Bradyrhizobium jicamae TaxID=280332 RepID=UPI001BA88DC4|nr:hypothetical protein [Bradyrhizobium jicamae]MBR0756605.1 hypothetical protein [Bradyrhizobium jicamae]